MAQSAGCNSNSSRNSSLAEDGRGAGLISDHTELVFCAAFALTVSLALYSLALPSLLALGLLWLVSRLLRARLTTSLQPEGKAVLITGCDSGEVGVQMSFLSTLLSGCESSEFLELSSCSLLWLKPFRDWATVLNARPGK